MSTRSKSWILSLAFTAILAPATLADGFGISFSKNGKHGAVSFGFNTGPSYPSCPAPGEPRCAPARWVPAHYETVYRPVWVEGCADRVWIEPVYRWRSFGCGRPYYACVREGHFEQVRRPGRYESRPFRTFFGGSWRT